MPNKKNAFPHWLAVFLVAAFMALVIGSVWFYSNQKQALQNAAEAQLISIGKLKARQIANWRAERINDASRLMESPFLSQGVAGFLADPSGENTRWLLTRFHSLQVHSHYTHLLLVDPEGKMLLNPTGKAENHSTYSAALTAALREHKPFLTELYIGEQSLVPCISAVAPIFAGISTNAPPLGAIIMISDASRFLYPLIQSWPTPSKSAETLIVQRDGQDALFLNDLRHQPNTALTLRMPLSRTDVPTVMAVRGRQGIFQGKDYRDVEVLACILPISDSDWFMVAKQDVTEVFAEWHLHALLILALFTAITGGLAAVGLIAWQQKSRYQMLYVSEARLREIELRYRNIFDNLLEGCQIIDFDWRYIYVNDAAAKHGRRTKKEMLGRTMMEVHPGIETIELFELLQGCMHKRKSHQLEEEFISADGTKSWFDLYIQPVPEGVLILSADISKRKQLEVERLEFECRNQQLAKIESLSCMAGAVAHHYNNLLGVVLGSLELAMEDLPPQGDTMLLLTAAEEHAQRAAALGRKMLVFLGQLPQGKYEFLDLARICEAYLARLRPKIPEGVALKTDLPIPGPVIKADRSQIDQMLIQLVTNAVEAIKTIPGVVRVLAEEISGAKIPKENRRPMVWEPSAETYACLSITDSGCGMSAKTINQIFDPFFTDKFTGRGLGLPMTLGILKSLDGCITITSAPKQGSTIRVFIPLLSEKNKSH